MQADDAIQRLYEDADLRDELGDEDANALLGWAEAQLTNLAQANADEGQIDAFFAHLRDLVKGMNRFVGRRGELDTSAKAERLNELIGTAQTIGATVAGAQTGELAQQIDGLDDAALVRTLTTLFTPATSVAAAPSTGETAGATSADATTVTAPAPETNVAPLTFMTRDAPPVPDVQAPTADLTTEPPVLPAPGETASDDETQHD